MPSASPDQTPMTQSPSSDDNFTFPIAMSDFTDDGIARIEAKFRAERIRRARAALAIVKPASDPEDAALEALPAGELDQIATGLAAGIKNGELA